MKKTARRTLIFHAAIICLSLHYMNYIDRKERQKYPARDLLISNSRLASCVLLFVN